MGRTLLAAGRRHPAPSPFSACGGLRLGWAANIPRPAPRTASPGRGRGAPPTTPERTLRDHSTRCAASPPRVSSGSADAYTPARGASRCVADHGRAAIRPRPTPPAAESSAALRWDPGMICQETTLQLPAIEIAPGGPAAVRPPTRTGTAASTQADARRNACLARLQSPARAWHGALSCRLTIHACTLCSASGQQPGTKGVQDACVTARIIPIDGERIVPIQPRAHRFRRRNIRQLRDLLNDQDEADRRLSWTSPMVGPIGTIGICDDRSFIMQRKRAIAVGEGASCAALARTQRRTDGCWRRQAPLTPELAGNTTALAAPVKAFTSLSPPARMAG